MLTLIERMQQRLLKRKNALLYPITYFVKIQGDEEVEFSTSIYAANEQDAKSLAIKMQARAESKIKQGGELAQWGFDLSEVKSNKLGLVLPWKDPVNKRSLNNGVKLPALRALATLRSIKYYATKQSVINKTDLSREQINDHLSKTVYSCFATTILLVIACYLIVVGITSIEGLFSKYGFSAAFVLTHCSISFAKIYVARKTLLMWREDLNE